MNAARFKYKEITDIILRSFKAENQNAKDLYMIIKEKRSVMISVDRRLSSYGFSNKTTRTSSVKG